jgi:RNA polymerase sigma-70 factor (ECF subfamily)
MILPVALPDVCLAAVNVSVEDLYRAEGRRLIGALTVFMGDGGEAEEVAQEAFARVIAASARITDPDRAVSYLYSTAFNLARSRWRRLRRLDALLPRLGFVGEVPLVESALLRSESSLAVTAAVSALPDRQRACVVLRYFSDMPVAEVAATLGISVNSAKTHLRRAAETLRSDLAPGSSS